MKSNNPTFEEVLTEYGISCTDYALATGNGLALTKSRLNTKKATVLAAHEAAKNQAVREALESFAAEVIHEWDYEEYEVIGGMALSTVRDALKSRLAAIDAELAKHHHSAPSHLTD